MCTFVLYNSTFSTAYVAGCLCLHHTKDTLLGTNFHTATMAIRTRFCTAAAFGTRSVAMFAGDIFAYLELFGNPRSDFLQ